MFTPNVGFTPRTRLELVKQAYDKWVELTGAKDSFLDFQGTNLHLLLNVFFEEIEMLEAKFVELQASQFDYWLTHNMAVESSFGSSLEGWIRVFSPLCTGVDLIGNSEDSTLKPGEIAIYFDNLQCTNEQLVDAFLKCKNAAEPTPRGDKTVKVNYSNGQSREYKYFNLLPENYTFLQVKIKVFYEKMGLNYKDSDFVDNFKKNFSVKNRINKAFYPESYLDTFPGVADFEVYTKKGIEEWTAGVRKIDLGNKFDIESVVVEIASI